MYSNMAAWPASFDIAFYNYMLAWILALGSDFVNNSCYPLNYTADVIVSSNQFRFTDLFDSFQMENEGALWVTLPANAE